MLIQSRRRLIAFIMIILVAVMTATLGIIYITTYFNINKENREMLITFAESYAQNGFPDSSPDDGAVPDGEMPDGEPPQDLPTELSEEELPVEISEEEHRYQVSTFYGVSFAPDGSVTDYMNDATSNLSDEELIETAGQFLESTKAYGVSDGIAYLVTEGEDYILVTLMDTAVVDTTITSLIHNMLIFGIASLVILFFLTVFLSGWIMGPLNAAYEKQRNFIADAGHELKTPITTVSANGELLKRSLTEEAQHKYLDNILYENRRMSALVTDLLELARLEKPVPVTEEVDFSELCEASVLPFEAAAYERGISLEYRIEPQLHLNGSSRDLEKLISVLTDNAISHASEGGKAFLSLTHEGNRCILSVENTGEEIPAEEKDRLFERFYRSDTSRNSEGSHYGLGLSIARAIVKNHGGSIRVDYRDGMVVFEVFLTLSR